MFCHVRVTLFFGMSVMSNQFGADFLDGFAMPSMPYTISNSTDNTPPTDQPALASQQPRAMADFLGDFSVPQLTTEPLRSADISNLMLPPMPQLPSLPPLAINKDLVHLSTERQLDAYNKALETLLKLSQLQLRMQNIASQPEPTPLKPRRRCVKRTRVSQEDTV